MLAGRYRLATLLGEGGVGEVWAATHLLTGREVAIKRLIVSRHGNAPSEARARFVLEAQSACAVDHPHVVQVLDFVDQDEEPPFLVMELLEGETLAKKLSREGALEPTEVARLLRPVVSAVGTAHARGIIHRDLKPSIIFLSSGHGERAHVKVLDFGIAKWVSTSLDEPSVRTQTGSTLGTPSYMSPEQATAERGVDHRADIWSIGVILYECLSGARPLEGENAAQMVMRLLSSGIIPIEHLVPGLPPRLAALIGRMLARDPKSRPDDLLEVFAELGALVDEPAPSFGKPRAALARNDSEAPQQKSPTSTPSNSSFRESPPETTWAPATLTPSDPPLRAAAPRPTQRPGSWPRVALALGALAAISTLALRWLGSSTAEAPSATAAALTGSLPVAAEAKAPTVPSEPRPMDLPAVASAGSRPVVSKLPLAKPGPGGKATTGGAANRKAGGKAEAPADATKAKAARLGLPRGAECDRSSDCASRVCLALTCE